MVQDLNGSWTTYTYDAKNRLTRDLTSGTSPHDYTYTYDGNDNRLSDSETGAIRRWTYNVANRLVTMSLGGQITSYSYEPNGSRTVVQEPSATYTFAYSAYKWLVAATQPGGTVKSYGYTADGLMRYADGPGIGVRTTVIWDGPDYLQERS